MDGMVLAEDLARYEDELRYRGVQSGPRMSYLRRLSEAYGGRPLLDLTDGEINEWVAGLPVSLMTHQSVVAYIKNALKFLNGGEAPSVSKRVVRRRGKARSRVRGLEEFPSEVQVEQLLNATPRLDLKALISLHIATGARPSEMLNLTWENVAFVTNNGGRALRISIRESKTDEPRTLITPDERTLRLLDEWKRAGSGTGPVWTSRNVTVYWKACHRLGIRAGLLMRIYPELFRHMRATELLELDYPQAVRDALMGWKEGSGQWANYTKLSTAQVEEEVMKREGSEEGGSPEEIAMLKLSKAIGEFQASFPGLAVVAGIQGKNPDWDRHTLEEMKEAFRKDAAESEK